jgi:BolA protein
MGKAKPLKIAWPIGACGSTIGVWRPEFAKFAAGWMRAQLSCPAYAALKPVMLLPFVHRFSLAKVARYEKTLRMIKGPLQTEMEQLLTAAFAPMRLAVINDSAAHHGHSGDDGSGESHFTVEIESAAFVGASRVDRQRLVNAALGDIPGQRVHALAIKARAPHE